MGFVAQAAVEPAASGGAFIGRPAEAMRMKRKTPSELRLQINRTVSFSLANAFRRTIGTAVFRVEKSRKVVKENCKDALLNNEKAPKSLDTVATSQSAESPFPSNDGDSAQLDSSVPSLAEAAKPGFRKAEKHSKNALRSVSELHIGDEKRVRSSKFDMDKVLKGFGARRASGASSGTNIQAGDVPLKYSEMCPSKITIPGKKAPLDLTMKTTLQFVSSSSVKWCHNLSTNRRGSVAEPLTQSYNGRPQSSGRMRQESIKEFLFSKALQSWVYPQSMLPAPINLYYMFGKNQLNIFYVYTTQFVALFFSGNCLDKQSCNAYLSQSTRGMRSLLRKQGVCFSMPLCKAKVEEANEDDLLEFSKIRTLDLGQTLHVDALSEVDNTTQSLLSFTRNKSVHGLYDVLLNYKYFLNSLSATDIPVLYSPAPFQNGYVLVKGLSVGAITPWWRLKGVERERDADLPRFGPSWCSTNSLGTPGMSEGFHAKMSRFSRMNSMSTLSYLGSRPAPIVNCLDESPGTKSTILVSSVGLNLRGGSASVVGFLRGDISARSTLAW
ncbi:hypothetical protein ZWY2020_039550 [Hordeum vulgare]|nr:hypothetical protein ZWY2020_039550 [Hordeum vulgare]